MFNRLGQCTAAFASGGFLISSVLVQQTQPQKEMATAVDKTRTTPPQLVKTGKSKAVGQETPVKLARKVCMLFEIF